MKVHPTHAVIYFLHNPLPTSKPLLFQWQTLLLCAYVETTNAGVQF